MAGATGDRAKFAGGTDIHAEVEAALRRGDGQILPNPSLEGSYRYVADAGRPIGTKGETKIRIIVKDGQVVNAFPVKNR